MVLDETGLVFETCEILILRDEYEKKLGRLVEILLNLELDKSEDQGEAA